MGSLHCGHSAGDSQSVRHPAVKHKETFVIKLCALYARVSTPCQCVDIWVASWCSGGQSALQFRTLVLSFHQTGWAALSPRNHSGKSSGVAFSANSVMVTMIEMRESGLGRPPKKSQSLSIGAICSRPRAIASASAIDVFPTLFEPKRTPCFGKEMMAFWIPRKL